MGDTLGAVAAGASSVVVVVVVMMTNAGTGPSVADALLSEDAAQARTAGGRLAAALGTLHLSTRGAGTAPGRPLGRGQFHPRAENGL
jgi:hypothetical protein